MGQQTNEKGAPVDVLAVLGALNLAGPDQRPDLTRARAAMAELIEALREIAAMEEREGDSLGTARSVARAALALCRGGES